MPKEAPPVEAPYRVVCAGLSELFDGLYPIEVPVCSEVTHPFALKLTTLTEQNWLGRSVATRVPNLRN